MESGLITFEVLLQVPGSFEVDFPIRVSGKREAEGIYIVG